MKIVRVIALVGCAIIVSRALTAAAPKPNQSFLEQIQAGKKLKKGKQPIGTGDKSPVTPKSPKVPIADDVKNLLTQLGILRTNLGGLVTSLNNVNKVAPAGATAGKTDALAFKVIALPADANYVADYTAHYNKANAIAAGTAAGKGATSATPPAGFSADYSAAYTVAYNIAHPTPGPVAPGPVVAADTPTTLYVGTTEDYFNDLDKLFKKCVDF